MDFLKGIFTGKKAKEQIIQIGKDSEEVVLKLDQSGVIISANSEAAKLFAYPDAGNLKGKNIFELIQPTIAKKVEIKAANIKAETELERSKDEFIYLTSHALRAPLTAIRGLISMIKQGDYGPVNKNLEKPLANISISAERLIRLVNNLLNISRAQTGKLVFNLTIFSLSESIEKVISELTPLAKEIKVDLIFAKKEISGVQGDQAKTTDIISNLISNALKFTNKGSIQISLAENEEMVVAKVTDTGIGISDSDQQKLFKRFEQISSATSAQIAGTGLGLYSAKMFATKMGGDVWLVKSEVNKGSTFALSLPKSESNKAKQIKEALAINHL